MPSSTSSSEGGLAVATAPGAAAASAARLTAADRPGVAQPVPVRDVPDRSWTRMLIGALLLAVALTAAWEGYWRQYGATPSFRDDAALWSIQRRRISEGEGDATVLVGSSRSFFDVQLPVWERLAGRRPIQLSLVGTAPQYVLEDLAADPAFRGAVLVDVAPDLFFSGFENKSGFDRYRAKESPSERVGKWLSMIFVEPHLAFYNEDFALWTVLRRLDWPERAGIKGLLPVRRLEQVGADRANHMWRKVETDAGYRALARKVWSQRFAGPPPRDDGLTPQQVVERQIARTAAAVARLRARGVQVLFVRHPTGGDYLDFERRAFPKASTWDPLLARTGVGGVHFEDYPELQQGFEFPEWSHMSQESATRYTAMLYRILERDHPLPDGRHW